MSIRFFGVTAGEHRRLKMRSSMFVNDCTNIDHAYINKDGRIIGGSYRPKFIVSGEIDPHEEVVVDFSTIKKSLKKLIDDLDNGFDHKLWWIDGFSSGKIQFNPDNTVHIKTQHVEITGPSNIVRVVASENDIVSAFVYPGQVQYVLTEYLENELAKIYPNVDISVVTELDTTFDVHPFVNSECHSFRYVHGLKHSSSFGCTNISHGHLSYLAASIKLNANKLDVDFLLRRIADELDKKVFIWDDNVVRNDQQCAYLTYKCVRGDMSMEVSQDQAVIVNTETTVEHLVDYIADRWYNDLKKLGVSKLWCSEGLSKGAVVDIE